MEAGCRGGLRGVCCHVAWPWTQTQHLLAAGALQKVESHGGARERGLPHGPEAPTPVGLCTYRQVQRVCGWLLGPRLFPELCSFNFCKYPSTCNLKQALGCYYESNISHQCK